MAENQEKIELKDEELEKASGGTGSDAHKYAVGDYVVYTDHSGNLHCYHIHELLSGNYYKATHCTKYPSGGRDYTGLITKDGSYFPSSCTVYDSAPEWCPDIDNYINFW